MCGIAAIIDFSERSLKSENVDIESILSTIVHRGPDSNGYLAFDNCILMSTRLAISDPRPIANMPMSGSNNEIHIIYNGEIYNRKELLSRFSIGNKDNKSDTELILNGYKQMGAEIFKMLNGIYSIVIYDSKKNIILMSRDSLGVKPLYYCRKNGKLFIASEIGTFKAFGIDFLACKNTVYKYLKYGVYDNSNESFIQDIYSILPGQSLQVSIEGEKEIEYQSTDIEINNQRTYDETVDEFWEVVLDCFDRQTEGCDFFLNLSGGIDSRIMLESLKQIGRLSKDSLCYTYSFKGQDNSEWLDTVDISDHYNIKPINIETKSNDIKQLLIESVMHYQEPFPGYPSLAKYNLFQSLAAETPKVCIEAQGGDELSGGYRYTVGPYFKGLPIENYDIEFEKYCKSNNISTKRLNELINKTFSAFSTGKLGSADGSSSTLDDCINEAYFTSASEEKPCYEINSELSFLNQILERDMHYTKLPRILKACDRASMAFSKELRVPLLDKVHVDFSKTVSDKHRFYSGLHRSYFIDSLPESIRHKGTGKVKKYVADPQSLWLWSSNKFIVEELIDNLDNLYTLEFYRPKDLERKLNDFMNKDIPPENSVCIWQFICLEYWMKYFVHGETS